MNIWIVVDRNCDFVEAFYERNAADKKCDRNEKQTVVQKYIIGDYQAGNIYVTLRYNDFWSLGDLYANRVAAEKGLRHNDKVIWLNPELSRIKQQINKNGRMEDWFICA